jgi:hypothetical protein
MSIDKLKGVKIMISSQGSLSSIVGILHQIRDLHEKVLAHVRY